MPNARHGARRIAVLAVFLSAAALAALLATGPGTRFGLLDWRTSLGLLRVVAYAGIGGVVLGLLAGIAGAGWRRPAAALVLGAAALSVPVGMMGKASRVPPIHDVSTDTQDPPAFADPARRTGALNPPEYAGPEAAAAQARAYPDVRPLVVAAPPAATFERALAAARAMGWDVVVADPASGRLEAVVTTRWFGFRDDVIVRIRPEGAGSRVDVRSKSRVGRSDLGANADRIQRYVARLREE